MVGLKLATSKVESIFINRFTMNNIAPKLQKCWTHKIAKATKLVFQSAFYTSKGSTCKVSPFYDFWFKFMRSSVAHIQPLTFYGYLITYIGKRNLKQKITIFLFLRLTLAKLCFNENQTMSLNSHSHWLGFKRQCFYQALCTAFLTVHKKLDLAITEHYSANCLAVLSYALMKELIKMNIIWQFCLLEGDRNGRWTQSMS